MNLLRNAKISQLNIADDYFEAYQRCITPDKNNHIIAAPGFMNGLFAAELYLKFLTNSEEKEHDLLKLFNELNESQRNILLSIQTSKEDYLFKNIINKVKKGFERWRYIFEVGNNESEETHIFEYTQNFLEIYLPVLRQMAKSSANA